MSRVPRARLSDGRAVRRYCQALLQWKARWQGVLRGHKSADRRAREMQLCRPRESTAKVGDGTAHEYEVTLHLPTSAPVRHITGERRGTRAAAKDSAVLRMICALWDRGAFDGFLRPMAPPELLVCLARSACCVLSAVGSPGESQGGRRYRRHLRRSVSAGAGATAAERVRAWR